MLIGNIILVGELITRVPVPGPRGLSGRILKSPKEGSSRIRQPIWTRGQIPRGSCPYNVMHIQLSMGLFGFPRG